MYTITRFLSICIPLIFLSKNAVTIRQLPVKSSEPVITTNISPTGNIAPAKALATPTLDILCTATLLAVPPTAIKAPASIPSIIIFTIFILAFVTPLPMFASIISDGVLNCLSMIFSFDYTIN